VKYESKEKREMKEEKGYVCVVKERIGFEL
jgi:hypothetical protein